jgi:hypothetical protein
MVNELTFSPPRVPRRQSLESLLKRADEQVTPNTFQPDFSTPVDRSKFFVCPSLTPLYYTDLYADLSLSQQRRYNQLCAMGFNELIAFFEGSFASSVLGALAESGQQGHAEEWSQCLHRFLDDEAKHIRWWRELNRLSDPARYRDADSQIIKFSPALLRLLHAITSRPSQFPVVFWIMLALEERSLDISKRVIKADRKLIEPRYRLIYKQHLKDESRHVQMDWHLIGRFYGDRSKRTQNLNARLLSFMMGEFFLKPNRSAVRVVTQLAAEHVELARRLPDMIRQLKLLRRNPEYHAMMYSRSTTPILFSLFDRFPAMHRMRNVLMAYEPRNCESR